MACLYILYFFIFEVGELSEEIEVMQWPSLNDAEGQSWAGEVKGTINRFL